MKKTYNLLVEDNESPVDYSSLELGQLQEIIGDLEDSMPKDKRTQEYKEWIKDLNNLFTIYNKKKGEKIYKLIK